jgi:hypothetical protein
MINILVRLSEGMHMNDEAILVHMHCCLHATLFKISLNVTVTSKKLG